MYRKSALSLLTGVLLCVLSRSALIPSLPISDLVETYHRYSDLLVLFVDTNTTTSLQFITQIRSEIEIIDRKYSFMHIALADKYTSSSNENAVLEVFDILSVPAVVYFKNGVQINLKRNKNISTRRLYDFLTRMVTKYPTVADSLEQLQIIEKEDSRSKVYYFTEDQTVHEWMVGFACKYPHILFVHVKKRADLIRLAETQQIPLFNDEDQSESSNSTNSTRRSLVVGSRGYDGILFNYNYSPELSLKQTEKFIQNFKKLYWTFASKKTIPRMMTVEKHFLLYVFDPKSKKDIEMVDKLRVGLNPYFEDLEVVFAVAGCKSTDKLAEKIGLPLIDSNRSSARAFVVRYADAGRFNKFIADPTTVLDLQLLLKFIFSSIDSKGAKHYKTEEDYLEMAKWDTGLANIFALNKTSKWKRVSGSMFGGEVIRAPSNHVLVFFLDTEASEHLPRLDALALKIPSCVSLTYFDTRLNEHSLLPRDYPGTFWLYKSTKDGKEEQPLALPKDTQPAAVWLESALSSLTCDLSS